MINNAVNNGKRQWVFIFLSGLFITNAITAELISSKLICIPLHWGTWHYNFITIVGVLPWPVVFLLTDTLNEFYGQHAVRRLSWITTALIGYSFLIVVLAIRIPAVTGIGVSDSTFKAVFGQTPWIILGSISAFLISQLLDVSVFHWIKSKTGNSYIWLRSTGSTVISQAIDTMVVLYMGFVLPGTMNWNMFWQVVPNNYILKLGIAIALTPCIYILHKIITRFLKTQH